MNKTDYKEFMKDMRDELIKIFKRPEFINRWKIEVTNILTKQTIDKIVYSKWQYMRVVGLKSIISLLIMRMLRMVTKLSMAKILL